MMLRGVSLPLLAIVAIAGAAGANSEISNPSPAEFSPAGFTGAEYIDSAGCAFVRARIGGATSWVPRMTRDRNPVCGQTPSLVPSRPEAVEALKPVPETAIEVIAAAPASVPKPRPAPRTIKSTSTKSATRPAPAVRRATQTVQVTCPARNGTSYSYVAQPGDAITCSVAERQAAALPGEGGQPIKALPKPPNGYKYAFGEGRHNPNRGERTLAGTASMHQIWTQEVPSRLLVPGAADLDVKMNGYRVSTKANAASTTLRVQAASYRSREKAVLAGQRLAARGLPVQVVAGRSGEQSVHVVLAGPFPTSQSAQDALRKVRDSGFRDARIRHSRQE